MKNRIISTTTLLFASVSAIIGSGWLFSVYYTAMAAGTSALLSWVIGAIAIVLVAFTFAELSALVPVTGASIRISRTTHGLLVGFVFAWITWVSYLALAAVEVQAIIQYGSYFWPKLIHTNGGLTHRGYFFAAILMLIVSTLNLYSLRWLMRCNNVFTVMKLIIPVVITGAILIAQYPHSHDTIQLMHFAPYGAKGIFTAITAGGIVFAFNGFKQAAEMAGEAINPQRSLPIALIGSIVICLMIYLLLQYAFLASIGSEAHFKIWQTSQLSGTNSPFAIVLSQEQLGHFLPILYLGAILGPFAAALMYCGAGARSLYAMGRNGSLPPFLANLDQKGIPGRAILINFFLGMTLFAPLPGWDSMANFLTSLMALSYIMGPVSLVTLRYRLPHAERKFLLPLGDLWGLVAFYICALLFYWTGWAILMKFFISTLIGFGVFMLYRFSHRHENLPGLDWRFSPWMWCFFIGMTLISYTGSFGGRGWLPFGWDFAAIGVLSMVSLWLARNYSTPNQEMQDNINALINHDRVILSRVVKDE